MVQNIFRQGMDAFDAGYDRMQGITDQRARRRAGSALAAGDRRAAMDELGGAGMIEGVRALENDQLAEDAAAGDAALQQQRIAASQAAERAKVLTRVAQGLKTVPAGQRKAALAQVYPLFQQMEVDTSAFDQLTEDQLTDQALDLFTGEVEKQLQIVNRGGGGYDVVDTSTGDVVRSVEPDPRLQVVGQGAVAIDPRTREPVYRNPKTFAPKSGGTGGGGAGLPPPPAGWTPVR